MWISSSNSRWDSNVRHPTPTTILGQVARDSGHDYIITRVAGPGLFCWLLHLQEWASLSLAIKLLTLIEGHSSGLLWILSFLKKEYDLGDPSGSLKAPAHCHIRHQLGSAAWWPQIHLLRVLSEESSLLWLALPSLSGREHLALLTAQILIPPCGYRQARTWTSRPGCRTNTWVWNDPRTVSKPGRGSQSAMHQRQGASIRTSLMFRAEYGVFFQGLIGFHSALVIWADNKGLYAYFSRGRDKIWLAKVM